MEREQSLQQCWVIHLQKSEIDFLHDSLYQNEFKMDETLTCKSSNYKTTRRETEEIAWTLIQAMTFLDMTPEAQATKPKNRQVGLQQAEKLMHSKGNNQQSEKTACEMGEHISKSYI